MRVVEFYEEDKDLYEDFVAGQRYAQFLQSWAWGEFHRQLGKNVWRLGFKEGDKILATAQIIGYPLRMDKSYLYSPRGPIFTANLSKDTQQLILELLLSKTRDICYATKRANEIFLRVEPDNNTREDALITLPLEKTNPVQPQHTWLLDLSHNLREILDGMHHKHRYNIKLSEKKGVIIRQSNQEADLKKFVELAEVTGARAGFEIWPTKYYHRLFETLKKFNQLSVWLAEYEGETLVANLVINYGDTVTYLHGGSSNTLRELMAPHLLQWEQIKWAQENGYTTYDFWGIAPPGTPKASAWEGITRFKQGFGGYPLEYLGTYDYVYENFWYKIYRLIKKIV
ncbi:MAG: aminoacyltransferase [Candidatus Komeilibacteria bacterium]|nr:aminoacyltransferase [Candidatus Komeilibacteria bacterium]